MKVVKNGVYFEGVVGRTAFGLEIGNQWEKGMKDSF